MRRVLAWLSGKSSDAAQNDPRWKALSEPSAECPCCGKPCSSVLSISFDRPDVAPANLKKEPNSALNLEGNILTEDFCRLGEDRLVRCIVEIPLLGLSDPFVVGVWSSLSQPNFDRFVETFDDEHQSELGEMTSWLCNPIPGDAQYPAAVWMLPQDGKQRPRLEFADQDHPLYQAQNNGLSFDDFAQLLKTYGHDIDCVPIN